MKKSPAFAGLFFGLGGKKSKGKKPASSCRAHAAWYFNGTGTEKTRFFGLSTGKKSILLTKFMRSFKFVKEEFTFTVKNVV